MISLLNYYITIVLVVTLDKGT